MKVTTNSSSSAFLSGRRFPPGFRFYPTDEELVLYYLKRKICHKRLLIDAISETDVYKWQPEELPDLSKLKTGDRQWFFFSPRDRKYPNGGRSNRATNHGYWKATGKDRSITCNTRAVGVKKTLVFYKGRAPTGIRTDWVMHEYTLDEEEFRRCKSAQDYYVLYKLFKKSGAGPKNGEQYGAPFNEEEWEKDDDSEYIDPNCPVDLEKSIKHVDDVALALIESPKPVNPQFQCSPRDDDFEELLNSIGNEPLLLETWAPDSENALLDHSSRELTLPQQCNVKANFELTGSGTSQPVLQEAPEVTSQVVREDFIGDFLEVDDLIPETNIHKFNEQVDTQTFNVFDGFDEFDMYTMEGGHATEPLVVNDVMNGFVNPVPTYLSDIPEVVNNQQLYFGGGNQLWLHDQRSDFFTYPDPIQGIGIIPPVTIPPGVNYDNDLMNQPVGATQFQSTRQDDDDYANSSFSSALWAFVESIPAKPASASESALVNKTIGRMSSFRRLRINAKNMNGAAAAAGGKASSKPRSGLICFSLLGVLCAILWLFIATAVGVVGG